MRFPLSSGSPSAGGRPGCATRRAGSIHSVERTTGSGQGVDAALDRGVVDQWRRVVRLYYPLVRHWCQRTGLQPDDAGDAAQEVFGILAGAIGRFQHDGGKNSFRGWLWQITCGDQVASVLIEINASAQSLPTSPSAERLARTTRAPRR